MFNPSTFLGAPVSSLQEMLRTLSYLYPAIPRLIPNGTFGEKTMEAVMVFQREFQLPVTGEVDLVTWTALAEEFQKITHRMNDLSQSTLFPRHPYQILPDQATPLLHPIQGMFLALSEFLKDIDPKTESGIHGPVSVSNTKWLQSHAGMPETGIFDADTWEILCRLYETFLVRNCCEEISSVV